MSFRRVMPLGELWRGEMIARVVDGKKVLLLRVEDEVFAYEDRCAHLGVALSEGRLEGTTITCSAHHYQYDALSGRGVNPRDVCLKPFAVKLEAGDIFVDVGGRP
jgi:toluene monooxygenase system ferredoxin subunit